MIRLLQDGKYLLSRTGDKARVLVLAGYKFTWTKNSKAEGLLRVTDKSSSVGQVLRSGFFRLYEVRNEPFLIGQQHLELCWGKGLWQGYLLPTGLPKAGDKSAKIISTNEIISVPKGPS